MGSGWGTVRYRKDGSIWLEVIRGSLELKRFVYGNGTEVAAVYADGKEVPFMHEKEAVGFRDKIRIQKSLELKAD
jgi:non-lysosomal glucosylceramidase